MSSLGYNFGGAATPSGGDQLTALQQVIQDIHQLMTVLTDPKATAIVSQCLTQLTRVQQDMMGAQQGNAQQAIGQRLTGQAY